VERHRKLELSTARCISEHEAESGVLNSTQRLTWTAATLPVAVIATLAEQMDREHFRAVERSVFRLIRCTIHGESIDCKLLGLVTVLRFGHPETIAVPGRISRAWHITGGGLARREASLGILTLEWTSEAVRGGWSRHCLSVRVHGYPSRFLPDGARGCPGPIRRLLGRAYARYHSVVTCRYLRRLARRLESAAAEGLNK
jgi:hypothetical protein